MLRGKLEDVSVGNILVLERANRSIDRLHCVYMELVGVLLYLEKNNHDFAKFFEQKTNLFPREECGLIKNSICRFLKDLRVDLNDFLSQLGYYSSTKRKDDLPFKSISVKNNLRLSMLNSKNYSQEEKFKNLSSYFDYRITEIKETTKAIGMSWKGEQFQDYSTRMDNAINYSLKDVPEIFGEYSKIIKERTRD